MPGQHQVEHDQVVRRVALPRQRGLAVRRLDDLVLGGAQVGHDHLAHGRVVVDHEHSGHGHLLAREPTSEAVTTPTRTSPGQHQPADGVVAVQQRGVVGPGAEPAEHRDGEQRHRAEHHAARRRPGPCAGPRQQPRADGHAPRARAAPARRRAAPPRRPARGPALSEVVDLPAEQQPPAVQRRRATPERPERHRGSCITPAPPAGDTTWSAARRAGSARSAGPGSRGRARAARRGAPAPAGCGRRRRSSPGSTVCRKGPDGCSESTSTSRPDGASTRSSRSRTRTPVHSPLGAPALDAGDRQGLASAGSSPGGPRGAAATLRSPCTTSRRYDGPTSSSVMCGRGGRLVDRHALRPLAGADRRRPRPCAATGPCCRRPRAPRRPRRATSSAAARAASGRRARSRWAGRRRSTRRRRSGPGG